MSTRRLTQRRFGKHRLGLATWHGVKPDTESWPFVDAHHSLSEFPFVKAAPLPFY
jgi:hypothetical protein